MERKRILILGAAGRDFHNFNLAYRNNGRYEVVGFTAAQIPNIVDRIYPSELSGELYPDGIPIFAEEDMERIVTELDVERVVMAYSDLSHIQVMHLASRVLAAGADFILLGGDRTMIKAEVPVIAVTAVRTGCGKSQTSHYVSRVVREAGWRVAVIRHPMPYGDLVAQRVQRFATYEDLERYRCTIEEREEYESYVAAGMVIYAGVDYEAIVAAAREEADLLIWDGGNNDLPFIQPDLWITVTDPFRAGHELEYHPGEANFRAADVVVINKVNSAPASATEQVAENARVVNPRATVVRAASEVIAESPEEIRGRRVLLIEDGPTLTHGGMSYGAGKVAADKYGAREIVDPRPAAVGSIKTVFQNYPHIGKLIPAMGYYPEQIADLEATINAVDCDAIIVATPTDLGKLIHIERPAVRVRYELRDLEGPSLAESVRGFLDGQSRPGN